MHIFNFNIKRKKQKRHKFKKPVNLITFLKEKALTLNKKGKQITTPHKFVLNTLYLNRNTHCFKHKFKEKFSFKYILSKKRRKKTKIKLKKLAKTRTKRALIKAKNWKNSKKHLLLNKNKRFAFKLYNYKFKLRKKITFFNFSLF